MKKVTLVENILEPSTWTTAEVADVCEFLFTHFNGTWPQSARIYLDRIERKSDVTPIDDAGVARLSRTHGHFYVVVYPQGLEIILLGVALVVAAVAIGLSFLLRPSTPNPQNSQQSPNNQLGNRENNARPNERIPDIFGQLWTTFDLLAVPYRTFDKQFEYEHCYMCVGRGTYDFASVSGILQIRDDNTPLDNIDGVQAQVFAPFTNPNLGSSPAITIGTPFTEDVFNLTPFGSVNGQLLQAPNISSFNQINTPGPLLRFRSPNIIETNTGADLTTAFQFGDTIYLGGCVANDSLASDPASIQPTVNLGGVYIVSAVSPTQLSLSSPSTVNPNWSALASFSGAVSNYMPDSIMANNPFWVGGNSALLTPTPPFWINHPEVTEIWCNFVAEQGSFKIDATSGKQSEVDNTIYVGITPCDASGVASGGETLYPVTLFGSHTDKQAKGCTLKITSFIPGLGGVLIRAHRTTNAEIRGGWNNSDAVQWRDCYIISAVGALDFGDVTTIQTITQATPNATSIKHRKMNALVTRKVQTSTSAGVLVDSTNAADIIYHMALDPFIGNLKVTDLDVTGIYAIAGASGVIQNYFKNWPDISTATQFCYTFDDAKVSFEESMVDIAQAIFCVAFRRGGKLSLSFEQQTANSTLLFNHRNKIPKSETRTVQFGSLTGNDGIDFDYVEPNAPNYPNVDTVITLHIPGNAVNPRRVKSVGVRNVQQATLLAWRMYWKLIAQNTSVQFECTEEAALLVMQDRILVADNTRSDSQDGEVLSQSVLILTLSQNVVFDSRFTYTIFLQHPDETVESIPITAGANPNQVIMGHAPSVACVTDPSLYAKTTYMIVSSAPVRQNAFLVTEKTPKDGKVWEVKAANYDDLFYLHDGDFTTNLDVAGMYLEVLIPSPPPNIDIDGFYLEVIKQ